MRSKPVTFLIAVTTIASLVVLLGASPAFAAPNATGVAKCRVLAGGGGSVSPGLTAAGSPGGVKINFQAKLGPIPGALVCAGGVTSPSGTKVIGGSLTGSGYYLPVPSTGNGSKCSNFAGSDKVGVIKVKITWITSGPAIAPTKITYASNPGTVVGTGTDTITLKAPPGTAIKSGSFAVPPAGLPNTVRIKTTLPGPACGSGSYANFTITGGGVAI